MIRKVVLLASGAKVMIVKSAFLAHLHQIHGTSNPQFPIWHIDVCRLASINLRGVSC